jgi:hypothetical protein
MAGFILTQNSKQLFKFYTYIHTRLDSGMVFYIGKGKGDRAFSAKGRNQRWNRTAKKHGWEARIHAHFIEEADAFENEKTLISLYRELNHPLCNMSDGGEGASGVIPSAETRKKIGDASRGKPRPPHVIAILRAANTGIKRTPEQIRANSEYRKGKKLNPETVKKIAAANTGQKRSEDARKNMSEAAKQRGISAETLMKAHLATRGMKRSKEFCAKVTAALTGRPVSKETRDKIRSRHIGRVIPKETRDKISQALTGKPLPEITKEKLKALYSTPEKKAEISLRFKGKPWSEERRAAHNAKKAQELIK